MDTRARHVRQVERRLEAFLVKLAKPISRSERRRWACVYLEGLLLDGERKSIEPLTVRTGAGPQALQQSIGQSPWDVAPVQEQLTRKRGWKFPSPLTWIINETSFPEAGIGSVGVTHRYCDALGNTADYQVAASPHFSTPELSCPVSWTLYLPEEWAEDSERRQKMEISKEVVCRTKNELVLELVDQEQRPERRPLTGLQADRTRSNKELVPV